MEPLPDVINEIFKPIDETSSSKIVCEENKILKAMLDSLSEGVIVADAGGKFLYFNTAAQNILGIGSMNVELQEWNTVYGCFYADTTTPFPSDKLPLARAIQNEVVDSEIIFIKNEKRPQGVFIDVSASPMKDQNGSVIGGTVIFRDVTGEILKERELNKLSNVVMQTADSVVITDQNGIIEYINPAFEKTTGYRGEEVLGQKMSILKSGVHDKDFYNHLWRTISSGNSYEGIIINRKKNGQLYSSEQTITPMKDESGQIKQYVSVLKDITQILKQQEQEVQIRIARSIQQQLYASRVDIPGFDLYGATLPAAETNGDYFDVIQISKDEYAMIIGDVSGHGIGAAMIMAQTRASLHAFLKHDTDPGLILTWLNRELVRDLDETRFVTLIFVRINIKNLTMDYASAGHIPGYILDQNGQTRQILDSTGIPLGFLPDYKYETSESMGLDSGDLILLLTDGIIEAHNRKREEFESERALETVRENITSSSAEINFALHQSVLYFTSGSDPEDDITSIVCRYKASG